MQTRIHLNRSLLAVAVCAALTACAGPGDRVSKRDEKPAAKLEEPARPAPLASQPSAPADEVDLIVAGHVREMLDKSNDADLNAQRRSDAPVELHMEKDKNDLAEYLAATPRLSKDVEKRLAAMPNQAMAQAGQVARHKSYNIQPDQAIVDRENYAHVDEHDIKVAAIDPVSTFSIDVDSGSYSNVRRFLNNHQLPPQDAVRVEELVNYFSYDYPTPTRSDPPFSVSTEVATTPWNADTWLMQIGLKGYDLSAEERPASNLVFLLDVSGSMNSPQKLPLLKKSFKLLTQQLDHDDRISIVVYAGASGVVLEPTAGDNQRKILGALKKLRAGGSTNGADGIRLAYQLAEEAFIDNGINRIVLATDGDFNVGTVNFEQLLDLAKRKRKSGVSLTTLGFGSGNYNDHLLEQLADAGNGNYAYIDSLKEAQKVLVSEISSTLHTIAKDVKVQVEFNPEVVAEYRLIGYENRALNREDFNNDQVDAGEIGAGHTVTALYELTPVYSKARLIDPLRYGQSGADERHSNRNEIAFLKLRYKQPTADTSQEVSYPINTSSVTTLDKSSENLRFAAAVSAFGQQLKGSDYAANYGYPKIHALARTATTRDPHGYRAEFMQLVQRADAIQAKMTDPDYNAVAIADDTAAVR